MTLFQHCSPSLGTTDCFQRLVPRVHIALDVPVVALSICLGVGHVFRRLVALNHFLQQSQHRNTTTTTFLILISVEGLGVLHVSRHRPAESGAGAAEEPPGNKKCYHFDVNCENCFSSIV